MGQKVNPHGLRVGVIKDWDSCWYAKNEDVGELLASDYKIRKFLKSTLYSAGIPRIEIERDSAKVRIYLHCARPGVVIGKGGTEIERLRLQLEKMLGKPVALNIVEVRSPDLTAQLIAENIAQQLEKRISFRRAMKQAIQRATRLGARGIKVAVSGRLGGAEIARSEHYHEVRSLCRRPRRYRLRLRKLPRPGGSASRSGYTKARFSVRPSVKQAARHSAAPRPP